MNKNSRNTHSNSGALGIFFILLAGTCWGSIGIFVRRFNALNLVSMDIVAVRSVFTVIFMAIFLAIYDKKLLKILLCKIKDYIQITDTKYKKPMELNKEGIYVPIKMDEKADLVKKGKITVFDDLMNSYDAKVADSFMLYAARIFIMSRETYTKILHGYLKAGKEL